METWQAITLAVIGAPAGIWTAVRWLLNWHHSKVREEREAFEATVQRILDKYRGHLDEALKLNREQREEFLAELKSMRQEMTEERDKRLEDTRSFADTLSRHNERILSATEMVTRASRPPKAP